MALHKIQLTNAQTPGPFDIYYRLGNSTSFVLLQGTVSDIALSNGICSYFPEGSVEVKIVNRFQNSNVEVIKPLTL